MRICCTSSAGTPIARRWWRAIRGSKGCRCAASCVCATPRPVRPAGCSWVRARACAIGPRCASARHLLLARLAESGWRAGVFEEADGAAGTASARSGSHAACRREGGASRAGWLRRSCSPRRPRWLFAWLDRRPQQRCVYVLRGLPFLIDAVGVARWPGRDRHRRARIIGAAWGRCVCRGAAGARGSRQRGRGCALPRHLRFDACHRHRAVARGGGARGRTRVRAERAGGHAHRARRGLECGAADLRSERRQGADRRCARRRAAGERRHRHRRVFGPCGGGCCRMRENARSSW